MENIIARTYQKWTEGLSGKEARISIFEHIRDIPYKVIVRQLNLNSGPSEMLVTGRGSCVPKHYLMGIMFREMGEDVRYCTYTFFWEKFAGIFSPELMGLTEKLPFTYHLACKVLIEGKWVLVDATWDPALAAAGFPVNTEWDGMRDTTLAVDCMDEVIHDKDIEREKFVLEKMRELSLADKLEFQRFSIALNRWLDSIRKNKNDGSRG